LFTLDDEQNLRNWVYCMVQDWGSNIPAEYIDDPYKAIYWGRFRKVGGV
jgi:hypothetical protein